MIEPTELGPFIKLFEVEGGSVLLVPDEEPRLDAALTAYLDSGCTRDRLIRLTLLDGDEYVTTASRISAWLVSTPEGRRRAVRIDKLIDDEIRSYREAAGYNEWEGEGWHD